MSHATSSEMAIDESKKRQKEETPPNSLTRQPKNKKKEEDEGKTVTTPGKNSFLTKRQTPPTRPTIRRKI